MIKVGAGELFLGVLSLAVTAFWIWMLVDCAKRVRSDSTKLVVWLVVIAITHGFGALAYFCFERGGPMAPPQHRPFLEALGWSLVASCGSLLVSPSTDPFSVLVAGAFLALVSCILIWLLLRSRLARTWPRAQTRTRCGAVVAVVVLGTFFVCVVAGR